MSNQDYHDAHSLLEVAYGALDKGSRHHSSLAQAGASAATGAGVIAAKLGLGAAAVAAAPAVIAGAAFLGAGYFLKKAIWD